MKKWPLLLAFAGLAATGSVLGAEGEYTCQPHPGSVVALDAPASLEAPLFTGAPASGLKHALKATWKLLSPKGSPIEVSGCFHEGYLRLVLPEIPQCAAEGCWIALRWVITERPVAAAPRPCQDLLGTSVAASRSAPSLPVAEKCLRR